MLEADLQRFYHVPLADLWRGELSLRRLSVFVEHLPAESATARHFSSLPPGWDTLAFLVADVYQALAGKAHPARPQPKSPEKASRYQELRSKLDAQKRRLREQGRTSTT
jgi:hypothetical protein